MLHNYHTHTWRCHHALGTEREYIENAIKMGMKTLGFSDHTPWRYPCDRYNPGVRMFPEQVEEYFTTLTALREEYKRDIDIKIGFEVEYYPAYFEDLLSILAPYPCDYMILGQHWSGNEIDMPHNCNPTDKEEFLALYVFQVLEGLRTGKFTYLAHPDLFNYTGDEEIYRGYMVPFCEEIRKMNIPVELNLLGLYRGRHYPSDRFYRIAAEVGNTVVLGIDAHEPDAILDSTIEARGRAFLKTFGITPAEDLTLRNPLG